MGALGIFIALAEAGSSRLVNILACIIFYTLGAWAVARYAGPVRRRVLELKAGQLSFVPDPRHAAECAYLTRIAEVLSAAENSLDRGSSTPAQHEVVWSTIYDEARDHLRTTHSR